jgi:bifunctional non-homologous end joining protein LigD
VTSASARRSRSTRHTKSGTRKGIVSKRQPAPPKITGAKVASLPRRIEVKLARLVKNAPEGDDWFHDIKFDGYHMICRIDKRPRRILQPQPKKLDSKLRGSRRFPANLPAKQAILNGEVVAFKRGGVTDFQSLQNVFSEGRQGQLVYYAFDLSIVLGAFRAHCLQSSRTSTPLTTKELRGVPAY